MNRITVSVPGRNSKKFEKNIEAIVRTAGKTLKILKKEGVEAEIYLVNGRTMRLLNEKFRGKDKTADVLSFKEPRNFVTPPSRFRRIGEIYLNLEKTTDRRLRTKDYGLRATAAKNKKSVVRSPLTVDRLLVHGLLHLLGYDHESEDDTIKMEKTESLVIKKLHVNHRP